MGSGMWMNLAFLAAGAVIGFVGLAIAISRHVHDLWQDKQEVEKANKRLVEENTHLRRNQAAEQPVAQYTPRIIGPKTPPYVDEGWTVSAGGVEYRIDDIRDGDWRNE